MTMAERMQLDYSVALKNRDQHDNGTMTPGDDSGWSFYQGVMDGLRMTAREIGISLSDNDPEAGGETCD